jgi:ATP-dependent Lon protease
MTFSGPWNKGKEYLVGDIVKTRMGFYVCTNQHTACYLTFPSSNEEVYWRTVQSPFENSLFFDKPTEESPWKNSLSQQFDPLPLPLPLPFETKPLSGFKKSPKRSISDDNINPEFRNSNNYNFKQTKTSSRSFDQKTIFERIENRLRKGFSSSNDYISVREQILLLKIDDHTKLEILDKYDKYNCPNSWINTVLKIPFGIVNQPIMPIFTGNTMIVNGFLNQVKENLDNAIYGLEKPKQEILEYLARKISNPMSRGHVLALCGPAGCGKTKLLQSLSDTLEMPFFSINFGGMNDVVALTGHSETYKDAKPGKIVEILTKARCMNPIIYLDEIDKISDVRSREINGALTHILDEQQNNSFQDNYLGGIPLDLSRVFFVIAFNDIEKVDRVVRDRMKVIYIEGPDLKSKVEILKNFLLPEIINNVNPNLKVFLSDRSYRLIAESDKNSIETGVRQIKKLLETVINKVNYLVVSGKLVSSYNISNELGCIEIKESLVEEIINECCLSSLESDYSCMYI